MFVQKKYYSRSIYFVLFSWLTLLYNIDKMEVNAGYAKREKPVVAPIYPILRPGAPPPDKKPVQPIYPILRPGATGIKKCKEKGKKCMSITNLREETNIPVGYLNPYELENDVKRPRRTKGRSNDENSPSPRSQLIGGRWHKQVLMFFDHVFTPKQRCYLQLGIDRINMYACIPLRLFEADESCNGVRAVEDCLMTGNTAWTADRVQETFQNETIREHIIVSRDYGGCESSIGRQGSSRQYMNLHTSCFDNGFGSVIHETLHALGYNHEHTRLDRDEHVKIIEENVDNRGSNLLSNFAKSNPNQFQDFGPYDLYSLMHYGAFAFSRDRTSLKTIVVVSTNADDTEFARIGQRVDLTQIDKTKIMSVTECPGKTYEEHKAAVEKIDRENPMDVASRRAECEAMS